MPVAPRSSLWRTGRGLLTEAVEWLIAFGIGAAFWVLYFLLASAGNSR